MNSVRYLIFIGFILSFAESLFAEGESQSVNETEVLPRFDQIFNNPYLIQSLNAGSQVIDNSFDSLLEGVFYHLLDQKLTQKLSGSFSFNERLNRQVFTTGNGKYVVVEKLNLGPSYKKALPNLFNKVPTNFNANTGIDLLSIYLRSDPQRAIEKDTLAKWRYWFNIWFGFIPFLEYLLPPAFDSNYLYDPLREITGPLSFPTKISAFKKMEIGTIQSFAYQGSISIPFSLDGLASNAVSELLDKTNLSATLPYTLFVEGEFRINILKKSDNIAWVGVSQLNRGGHSLAGFIGSTIYLLSHSLGSIPWKGIPAQFSPIDVNLIDSLIDKFDQVFEFDLNDNNAVEYFEQALLGNFTFSKKSSLPSGVRFQFSQDSLATEFQANNTKNAILLYKNESHHFTSKSELKIKDSHGEFFVLENISEYNDGSFNIFTGEKAIDLSNEFDVNVEKEKTDDFTLEDPKFYYRFHHSMKPYQLILKFQIKDRFAYIEDFRNYLDLIRTISKLPLDSIPEIPSIPLKNMNTYTENAFFSSPNDVAYNLHAAQTAVGKFNANVLVIFDTSHIQEIVSKNHTEISEALYSAFKKHSSEFLSPFYEYFWSYTFYPLRILNYKSRSADAYREIENAKKALFKIHLNSSPEDMLDSFHKLFSTDYPYEIVSALYTLSDLKKVPRSVTLYISPSQDLSEDTKKILTDLNSKTFYSEAKFPELERYRIAKNKLTTFVPTSLKDSLPAPMIQNTTLIEEEQILKISLNQNSQPGPKRIFLKIKTNQMLKISETNIGEKLFELNCLRNCPSYEISLSSTNGPLSEILNDENLIDGSLYKISISVSELEGPWSEQQFIEILYKNGKFKKENK